MLFNAKKPTLILYRKPKDKNTKWAKEFQQASEINKDKMHFAYTYYGIATELAEFLGVTREKQPALFAFDPETMNKYKYDGVVEDINIAALNKFVDDVIIGLVEPHIKTEEPVQDDGPLKTVVGVNFNEIVMDESKDVFVFFIVKSKRNSDRNI